MQHGLAQWLAFLSDKQLPVLQRTRADVLGLIKQTQLSITQYSTPIVYDAGFSSHVFRHVNTQRVSSGKNPLTTMGNALSHMGQSAFQDFINKTPLLEELELTERNNEGYIRVMGQACHAALQAKNWALQRNVTETEETQLAALQQNIAELMLWCYGGDVMPKIEELCYVNKQAYESAANTVLGCGMRELGSKLAIEWNLPEMAVDGLLSKQDNFTLACGVSLASEFARIVSLNWYGKNAEDIVKRIAKYKGSTEGEIDRRLHLNAVELNDVLIDKGFDAPARLLFQLADDDYNYPQFIFNKNDVITDETVISSDVKVKNDRTSSAVKIEQSVKSVKANSDIASSKKSREEILEKIKARKLAEKNREEKSKVAMKKASNASQAKPLQKQVSKPDVNKKKTAPVSKELAAAIKEFQVMVSQAKPAHDLIEYAVKACLLCGVQRSVFVIKVPNKDLLVTRYSAQTSDDIAIKKLKISTNKPNLFSLLMEKSRNFFLNDSNRGKYWKSLPDSVKLALGVKQFFAMSIFVNNHAMGLMYADKLKGDLTQAEYAQFQGICRLLSKGIIQSAHNKHK